MPERSRHATASARNGFRSTIDPTPAELETPLSEFSTCESDLATSSHIPHFLLAFNHCPHFCDANKAERAANRDFLRQVDEIFSQSLYLGEKRNWRISEKMRETSRRVDRIPGKCLNGAGEESNVIEFNITNVYETGNASGAEKQDNPAGHGKLRSKPSAFVS
jgi:hypothetical protein